MKKITLSVAFGLLLGFAGSFTAKADSVVVPEFRTDAGWTTLVTVIDTYASTAGIHWMYRWDDPLTPVNECGHTDAVGATTPNDMGTINIATPPVGFGNTPAMFGDATTTGLTLGPGFKGLLTLYNFSGTYNQALMSGTFDGPEDSLEAVVHEINFVTGEVQTIRAPNDTAATGEGNLDDLAYGAWPAPAGGQFFGVVAPNAQDVLAQPKASWLPTGIVSTSWEVIVLTPNTAFDVPPANSVTLSLGGTGGVPVVYDIDENPLSGVVQVTVDCFGKLTLADFLTPLNLSLVANGGWAYINMVAPTAYLTDVGILVYKEETATIAGRVTTQKSSANRVDF